MARLARTKTVLNKAKERIQDNLRNTKSFKNRTGNLRGSFEVLSFLQKTQDLEAQVKMLYYGVYLNDGTKYIQPPRKFVEKAVDDAINDYLDQIGDALESDIYASIIKPNSDS